MDVIKEIEAKLGNYLHVEFESQSNSLKIFPITDGGFTVSLYIDDCYVINFDGWHEELTDPKEVLDCIAFGLSTECRLKVRSRGDWDHEWTVESKTDDGWKEESTTGLFFYPFWKEKKERYLQNDLIKLSAHY